MTADPTDDPTEGAASGDPSLSRVRQRRLEDAVDIIRRNMTRRARRIDSPRFSLWADVTEPAVSRRLSDALESAFSVLDRILGGRVPPQPEPRRVRVFLFDTHLAFERVKRELGISSRAHGFYRSPGLIVLHSDLMHDDRVFMVCLHEAVHAYLGRYVFRPGVRPPPWLGEGLAEYVASSRLERGELIPGRLPRGVLRDHLVGYVRTLRRALRAGAARGLGEMLEAGEDAIPTDRDERDRFYGSAWMTVHFLRHGRPEWADEAFPTLVLYLAEGYREGVFEAAYGLSPGELEDEFREYVRVFPRER